MKSGNNAGQTLTHEPETEVQPFDHCTRPLDHCPLSIVYLQSVECVKLKNEITRLEEEVSGWRKGCGLEVIITFILVERI